MVWIASARVVLTSFYMALLLCAVACYGQVTGSLPALTATHQVHSLSRAEAERKHPVHIRGWVAYYDPYIDPTQACMFLHDTSGDVFVSLPKLPLLPLRQGMPVEVTGWSGPGEFAPVVSHGKVHVLSERTVKLHAPSIILPLLIAGGYDARFAEVEGVVQSFVGSERNIVLKLSTGTGVVLATTLRERDVDYTRLIDAQIRLRANIGPQFNHRRQVTGAHLFFQSMEDVTVRQAAPKDPFSGVPRPIQDLTKLASGLGVLNGIHIRGRATLHWPGHLLCLQDDSGGLCVETKQWDKLELGQFVDVVGFPTVEDSTTGLIEARFLPRAAAKPVVPSEATAKQLLSGHHAGELVTIEGRLINTNQDIDADAKDWTLTVESAGKVFPVVLPSSLRHMDWHVRTKGSLLRLTGVFLPQTDSQNLEVAVRASGFDSFRLLLRSPMDVLVLETPTWWSGAHLLYVLSLCALLGMTGCAWVIVLRRRVEQQTQTIRTSEERFRHLAEHDGLTGLANRRLLHQRLEAAMALAGPGREPMAVLMMDLDKFKQVNDTFGHHVGDAMLCAAAERIRGSVREEDTVARTGGDEFVVLLPRLRTAWEADAAAERIVTAISKPLEVDGQNVPMSASVGVCAYQGEGCTAELLLRNCDTALYGAKTRGRNCWQSFGALSYSS